MGFPVASRVFLPSGWLVHALAGSFHFAFVYLGSVVRCSGRVLCFGGMGQALFYIF